MSRIDKYPEWQSRLRLLLDSAWSDAKLNDIKVAQWLSNFTGESTEEEIEERHALHLLLQFIYYGKDEVEECMRVLFDEKIAYPYVQECLQRGLTDPNLIVAEFSNVLRKETRFVPVGLEGESGSGLIYPFRQANDLPNEVISSTARIIDAKSKTFDPSELKHLIYFDDFCGTGDQIGDKETANIDAFRKIDSSIRITCLLLGATKRSLAELRNQRLFDSIDAAIVFDDDYRVFGLKSHYYMDAPVNISQTVCERMMRHYSMKLGSSGQNVYGHGDCQLAVGFEHNTPDNSLPTFWAHEPAIPWHRVFKRKIKR